MSTNSGGVIRLTCGGVGTGKTYKNVKDAEEAKKSGKYHKIYSNIRSHSKLAEGITLLPEDWRDCDTDSLIIIDEIQMHEKFSKHFSSRRDSEIADLSMIRHKRIDIWMISPDPALVNSDVRNLVNQYVWLEIVNKKVTHGWCFTRVHNKISKSIKNTSYEELSYTIEEKYYNLYESTIDGKPSGRNRIINFRLIGFIVGMIIVISIAMLLMYFLISSTKKDVDKMADKENKSVSTSPLSVENLASKPIKSIPPDQVDFECRKAENVNLAQCVDWFNNLTRTGASVRDLSVNYDPNKPFDLDHVAEQITYEVTSKPKFSGCAKFDNKYYAYTEQGTYLNVSSTDCQKLLSDAANRPYDYFANSNGSSKTGSFESDMITKDIF